MWDNTAPFCPHFHRVYPHFPYLFLLRSLFSDNFAGKYAGNGPAIPCGGNVSLYIGKPRRDGMAVLAIPAGNLLTTRKKIQC